MSVRRENIEEQAMRLRSYVSEAVLSATGATLPMTQTLDQMVRAAAKAGVLLSISTDHQSRAIEMLSNQLRLIELSAIAERDKLKAENEALRNTSACVDDLSALVRQLVQRLRKAAPDSDLPAKALDYLQRKGLQGSPMRSIVEARLP